jgi:hypothetical protein
VMVFQKKKISSKILRTYLIPHIQTICSHIAAIIFLLFQASCTNQSFFSFNILICPLTSFLLSTNIFQCIFRHLQLIFLHLRRQNKEAHKKLKSSLNTISL